MPCAHVLSWQVPAAHYSQGKCQHDHITISRKEYDLLLLRECAISVLAEGMTIADCSLPDMPLMWVYRFDSRGLAPLLVLPSGQQAHEVHGLWGWPVLMRSLG